MKLFETYVYRHSSPLLLLPRSSPSAALLSTSFSLLGFRSRPVGPDLAVGGVLEGQQLDLSLSLFHQHVTLQPKVNELTSSAAF